MAECVPKVTRPSQQAVYKAEAGPMRQHDVVGSSPDMGKSCNLKPNMYCATSASQNVGSAAATTTPTRSVLSVAS